MNSDLDILDHPPTAICSDVDRTARSSISSSSNRYSPLSHAANSPGWTPETLPDTGSLEAPPAEPTVCTPSKSSPPLCHSSTTQDILGEPSYRQHVSAISSRPSDQRIFISTPSINVSQHTQHQHQAPGGTWQIGQQFAIPAILSHLHATGGDEPKPKRGRGRPRKLPIQEKPPKLKGVKNARSKTGCLTCRKRKKKCDETKPTCINCRKNGKECEGYPDLATLTKSKAAQKDKQKIGQQVQETDHAVEVAKHEAAKLQLKGEEDEDDNDDSYEDCESDDQGDDEDDEEDADDEEASTGSEPEAAEVWTKVDGELEDHFTHNSNQFFAPWASGSGRFHRIMTQLAREHDGIRHGLLCLSAQQLLQQEPQNRLLQRRYMHHLGKGVKYQLELYKHSPHRCDGANPAVNDAYTALALIFCLANEISGAEHLEGFMLPHYGTVVHMAYECPQKSANAAFQKLVEDFFYHHNLLALVTSTNQGIRTQSHFKLAGFVQEFVEDASVTLFGGMNSLWMDLSNINAMRERIRYQRQQHAWPDWSGDMQMQSEARELESYLITDPIAFEAGTWQHAAASLYRLSTLIYLYRTVMPSQPNLKLAEVVDRGITFFQQLESNPAAQGVLLMPLFLLGCAAFQPLQRQQIGLAFARLAEQRGDGNVQRASKIVRALWVCMDTNDEASWDWENLGHQMGCALLVP